MISVDYSYFKDNQECLESISLYKYCSSLVSQHTITSSSTTVCKSKEIDDYFNWLERENIDIHNVELRVDESGNRGLFAARDMDANETFLVFPKKMRITSLMGQQTSIGQKLLQSNTHFFNEDHVYLSLYLLLDMKNPHSFFQPYYALLPKDTQSIPVEWTSSQFSLMKGSTFVYETQERRTMYEDDYKTLCSVDSSFQSIPLSLYIWSRIIVSSRNFGIQIMKEKEESLVPLADMINHSNTPNCYWMWKDSLSTDDSFTDCFCLISLKPIKKGEELFYSYGLKTNRRFLLSYGFTIDNNYSESNEYLNELQVILTFSPKEKDLSRSNPSTRILSFLFQQFYSETHCQCLYFLSTNHLHQRTLLLYQALRLYCCSDDELYEIYQCWEEDEDFQLSSYLSNPISLDNELLVLEFLSSYCLDQMREYNFSYMNCLFMIKEKRDQHLYNDMNALIVIRDEMRICLYYAYLYRICVQLQYVDFSQIDEVIKEYKIHKDIYSYLYNIFMPLLYKFDEEDEGFDDSPSL